MKEFRNPWFVMLGYLFLIKPGIISGIPALRVLDATYDIFRIVIVALTVMAIAVKLINVKSPAFKVLLLILIGEVWKIIASLLFAEGYVDFGALTNTLGMVLFTYTCLEYSPYSFLQGSSRILGLYVLINAATVLLFPNGMYTSSNYSENYFLSYRTAWFPVYLLAAMIVLLNAALNPSRRSRNWCYCVIGAIFLSLFWVWTATGIFCFSLAALLYLFCWKCRRGKPIKGKWVLIVEASAFLMLAIFRLQEKLAFILVTILKKDVTMTSRLRIWDNAMSFISENLVTGVGNLDQLSMKALLGFGVTHAHNYYLDTTLRYGIIGLILLFLPIGYTLCKKYTSSKTELISVCTIFALMTAYQVECYSIIEYYLLPVSLILCSVSNLRGRSISI